MENEMEILPFSGKFETVYPDGTIGYDGRTGSPEDFPLTEMELEQYHRLMEAYSD